MIGFVVVLVTLFQVHALIEWPFLVVNRDMRVNMTVGVPGQALSPSLEIGSPNAGLSQQSKEDDVGIFKRKNSTTFKLVKNYTDIYDVPVGILGLEDFVITTKSGTNLTLKQLPMKIILDSEPIRQDRLSLAHSKDGNTFFERLLEQQGESVAVLTFDKIPKELSDKFSGVLTLGGRPDYCTNWTYVPESVVEYKNQWNFVVDSYKIGNLTYSKPSNASIQFIISSASSLSMWPALYHKTIKELNADEDDEIKCKQSKKIVFSIGGKEFELNPEDYMAEADPEYGDYSSKQGLCRFIGSPDESKNTFVLPLVLLRNKCISFDFKSKRIGFADKKN